MRVSNDAAKAFGLLAALAFAGTAVAAQVDITGPAGSVAFGAIVKALPNGNIVVADPKAIVSEIGAVYLYDANGNLISTLTGGAASDHIGSGGIRVVGNSNFLVLSPEWHSGANANAGAVTWVNGSTGLNGVVSAANSLVGSSTNDSVGAGLGYVVVLSNGNYVVQSRDWNNGSIVDAGAVTWGAGNAGVKGAVSAANSLVGSSTNDQIGFALGLNNGNYVVTSGYWDVPDSGSGAIVDAGAATWVNGATGLPLGPVSVANSLTGAAANHSVGGGGLATGLSDGNYVVKSPGWDNGALTDVGAATWCNGASGTIGTVSAANSLVGTKVNDAVASPGVLALGNGNYVVLSSNWGNGAATKAGAVTWRAGGGPSSAQVSAGNSLVGTTTDDQVGYYVAVLSNGNYVVDSPNWGANDVGAVTWASGAGATSAVVSPINSLTGSTAGDQAGSGLVIPLKNGHYVVASPMWDNAGVADVGAVTWGNGTTGIVGSVSAGNSLIGSTTDDREGDISAGNIVALANGNYVVANPVWNAGVPNSQRGAVTWVDGSGPTAATVSGGNSLIGSTNGDQVGYLGVTALGNGNYIVTSPYWDGGAVDAGAITWANGTRGLSGTISAANSLVGGVGQELLGYFGVRDFGDGHYSVYSSRWFDAGVSMSYVGAVTLGDTRFRLKGSIAGWNSVLRFGANPFGSSKQYDYDLAAHRLVVGRPAYNVVSLFTSDQVFAGDFEP